MKNRKTRVVSVRVSPDQHAKWAAEASAMGVSLSQWLVFRANGVIVIQKAA